MFWWKLFINSFVNALCSYSKIKKMYPYNLNSQYLCPCETSNLPINWCSYLVYHQLLKVAFSFQLLISLTLLRRPVRHKIIIKVDELYYIVPPNTSKTIDLSQTSVCGIWWPPWGNWKQASSQSKWGLVMT